VTVVLSDRPVPARATDPFRGRDVLCFSHDWTGDPLSKTHLMRLLARDSRVLWVNSIGYRAPTASAADLGRAWRKLKAAATPLSRPLPNLHVLNPLAVPAWGSPAVRAMNAKFLRWQVRRAMRRLGFRRPINWVFNPAATVLAGQLGEDRVIYYCVDEYTAFSGVPSESLIELERGLLRRADLVVVSAERLLRSKGAYNPRTVLVRHGVDYDHFRTALDPATVVPEEIRDLPRPVIGYFGLMSPDWVDVPLLEAVARHSSGGSLVLIGKVAMDLGPLTRLANVHVLGRRPYEALPAFCKGFDVAVIPFPVSEVTLSANPLKAREYLAAGLPVVSTPIPEVEVLGQCAIGRTPDEFVCRIDEALDRPGPDPGRSEAMRTEGWAARLDEVRRHYTRLVLDGRHS
jgi:glycosyltransferase involved in cell wall biosynthesis